MLEDFNSFESGSVNPPPDDDGLGEGGKFLSGTALVAEIAGEGVGVPVGNFIGGVFPKSTF